MAPNVHRVWTPRLTFSRFRQWPHKPSILEYKPPPPIKTARHVPTSLGDGSARADLDVQLGHWDKEIAALEAETSSRGVSLKEQLASLMFRVDVPLQIKKQEALWDPKGDGTITRGEFRMHIRGIGVRPKFVPNEAVDALFDEWDADGSGSLDMEELEMALTSLKAEFDENSAKESAKHMAKQMQLELLRKRVKAGRAAIQAHAQVEACSAELLELTEEIASRLDIQLGGLLSRRGIKAGELVGTWQGVRPIPSLVPGPDSRKGAQAKGAHQRTGGRTALFQNDHRNELTKGEFVGGVKGLGLRVGGDQQPPTTAALSRLFEQVDADASGFLDLREAVTALKQWQRDGKSKYAEKADKARELVTLKTKATRLLQEALREPEPAKSPDNLGMQAASPPPSARMEEGADRLSVGGVGWRMRLARGILTPRSAGSATEAKAEAQAKAQARAKAALGHLMNSRLARGWTQWRSWYVETVETAALLLRTLGHLSNRDLGRTYRTWLAWYQETRRMQACLVAGLRRIKYFDEMRAWHTWVDVAADAKSLAASAKRARRAVARFHRPELVKFLNFWLAEARLDNMHSRFGVARRDAKASGGGTGVCYALARCVGAT